MFSVYSLSNEYKPSYLASISSLITLEMLSTCRACSMRVRRSGRQNTFEGSSKFLKRRKMKMKRKRKRREEGKAGEERGDEKEEEEEGKRKKESHLH